MRIICLGPAGNQPDPIRPDHRAHSLLDAARFIEAEVFTPLDVTALGFPKSLAGQLQIPDKYPIITFENYLQTSRSLGALLPSDTFTAQGNLLKIAGKHSMKFGGEYRVMRFASFGRITIMWIRM